MKDTSVRFGRVLPSAWEIARLGLPRACLSGMCGDRYLHKRKGARLVAREVLLMPDTEHGAGGWGRNLRRPFDIPAHIPYIACVSGSVCMRARERVNLWRLLLLSSRWI